MKYFLLICLIVGIGFFLGNEFGAATYYYYKVGIFQSSTLALIQSSEELLLRGIFSVIFSLFPMYLLRNKYKHKTLFRLYLFTIASIKLSEFFLTWKSVSNFNLSTLFDIMDMVFINIQMLIFVLVVIVIMLLLNNKNRV